MRQRAMDFVIHGSGLAPAKSVDNLHMQMQQSMVAEQRQNGAYLRNGCIMPANSCNDIIALNSQQGIVVPPPANRFRVERPDRPQGSANQIRFGHYVRSNLADRKLRIRLLGLDCYGIQTLELEKLEPGPFGFYIATGMFKRKKGIFISRVNAKCLTQLISIGDQLLEVDAVSTKGKSLEQCQALIANKQKIVVKILPVIMR